MTSLGVACKDDIPANRWEFLLRNCKQTNRVVSSQKYFAILCEAMNCVEDLLYVFCNPKGRWTMAKDPCRGTDHSTKYRSHLREKRKKIQNVFGNVCSTYFSRVLIGPDGMVETNPSTV